MFLRLQWCADSGEEREKSINVPDASSNLDFIFLCRCVSVGERGKLVWGQQLPAHSHAHTQAHDTPGSSVPAGLSGPAARVTERSGRPSGCSVQSDHWFWTLNMPNIWGSDDRGRRLDLLWFCHTCYQTKRTHFYTNSRLTEYFRSSIVKVTAVWSAFTSLEIRLSDE